MKPSDNFAQRSDTELAPMSTTTDIETAVCYSVSQESLIFKIVTQNNLQRGRDLKWQSALPQEAEILFPSLTYLQPTGRTQVIPIDNICLTIMEVLSTIS
jgi:hypothetical protein